MKKIGLLWHNYPSENLGVGALSYSHFCLIEEALKDLNLDVGYHVIGMMPSTDNEFQKATARKVSYSQFSIRQIAKNPLKLLEIKKAISECFIVFDLSEGDSFTDIYGFKRFLQQALSKALVINCGKELVLSPQTIGPFNKGYGKVVSNFILKKASAVFARDEQSYRYLVENGHQRNSSVVTDLAFALPYNRENVQKVKENIDVGINISGLLMNGGYNGENQFGLTINYPSLIESIIEEFSKDGNVRVHLVSHVITDRYAIEDDYRASLSVKSKFPECVLAPKFSSPVEAKSYISNLDFFTGARMHATIAAFSSGVPVVPVAYSRKFSGLYGTLGYKNLVDGQSDTTQAAIDTILEGYADRANLAKEINKSNVSAQTKLGVYKTFLKRKFESYE
ncbi:polysaccharide pyruvyl transferase family protein [Pseudomonas sp. B21-017]|uniref:polysaccharide pyruvyl transferase family protein n=1 Tax=Pseudomonas sp. B21-017 TaxID=2895474 RepID=UPI00215ED806|nr:polysaccharide pyruvyl transferase family protein [Pseudomonas sp. B21-017]UVM40581.1 polysaccharide pyruvyl transferase family protein [Pseudomonas sp. B21-017]